MTYRLYGSPGSPYVHKPRAVLRYRRLPHTWLVPRGGFTGAGNLGADGGSSPLQRAGKTVTPVLEYPDGSFKADTTPIMYDLEARHSERSLLLPAPALAFLAHLVEDMADEYLPLPMFYFRWTEDKAWCARRQMIGWSGAIDDPQLEAMANSFLQRQTGQLGAAVALPRATVLGIYTNFLDALESQLKRSLLLFGDRPSFAEFGLYGQLTQYLADPTLSAVLRERALRVFQWIHFIDDLSGHEDDWATPDVCLTDSLQDLLADLDDGQRTLIQPLLTATGCWDALQFEGDEAAHVVPISTQ